MTRLLPFLLLPCLLVAQITFMRPYGGTGDDKGSSVIQTSDGGYAIAGSMESNGSGYSDAYLVKTDAYGDTSWSRVFGGARSELGWSVTQTPDGGYLVGGYTTSIGAGGSDAYLVKTSATGNPQWTRTYGGAESDRGYSVGRTADGGYAIAGYSVSSGAGSADAWLVKTSPEGDSQWARTYGGARWDEFKTVRQTADGGYVVAGGTESYGAGSSDVYIVKTNHSGMSEWTRVYGGASRDIAYSVQQTTDGGYVLAGYTRTFGAGQGDVWLLRIDANGDSMWTRTFGGTGNDGGNSVQQTSDGGFVVAGHTMAYPRLSDFWLVRTDSFGDSLWTRCLGGWEFDYGREVRETEDGGYIIVGYSWSYGAGESDALLVKTDSLGRVGIAETPEPERAEPLRPTVLTGAQLQAELQQNPSLSLFDASGRAVANHQSAITKLKSGVFFLRSPEASHKVLVTE